jgi:hypothetical protein
LHGRLPALQLNDEPKADAGGTRELVLSHSARLAGRTHDTANIFRIERADWHFFTAREIFEVCKSIIDRNIPSGKYAQCFRPKIPQESRSGKMFWGLFFLNE